MKAGVRIAVGIALLAALLAPPAGGATTKHSAQSPAEVREYWTAERLREAEPLEPAASTPLAPAPLAAPAGGEPGFRAPSPPAAAGPGDSAQQMRTNTGEVAAQTDYPQSTNGKLYFLQSGYASTCSASVAPTGSDNVVITAGHCLYDPYSGAWSKRLIFIPAFRSGGRPFGTWGWKTEVVHKGWYRAANPNYDYGAIKMRPSGHGTLGDVVGEQGVMWNYPRQQTYRVIGYPANFGNTQRMWGCVSGYVGGDGRGFSGPSSSAVDCNMKRGSSGGGWTFMSGGRGPFVGGVSTHFYSNKPALLYGPYFTRDVLSVLRQTNGG